jgi:HEAT repeat protein
MLNHHAVQVVLNVAELLGDLREESAVPALTDALKHYDERVQKAAATALARIGSAATVEGLQTILEGDDVDMRALVARTVGGRQSKALTMPILEAADDEENPVVQAEYYRALGRIGSVEAVQALVKAAQPSGRLSRKKKPMGPRLAAIEGLKLAGGPVAYRALDALSDNDPEAEVRDQARFAAQEIKRPPAPSEG